MPFKVMGIWWGTREKLPGLLGVVLYREEGKQLARAGIVDGKDEEADLKSLMSQGFPFPLEAAHLLCTGKPPIPESP